MTEEKTRVQTLFDKRYQLYKDDILRLVKIIINDLQLVGDIQGSRNIQGEKGDKGDKGDSAENGINGVDGREIEIHKGDTHIQWRYAGEEIWNNLVALIDIKGANGSNGADGYTPIKGTDYFDGVKGDKGDTGPQGIKGDKGDDGYTPIKGVDYFDGESGFFWVI